MLKSLKIKNFRALEDFYVEKLGQVNLIVGKNNSGKSSVLEALRIYAGNASQELLQRIAQEHDEVYSIENGDKTTFDGILPFEDFYTGRKFPEDDLSILIGDNENPDKTLSISTVYIAEKEVTVLNENGVEEKEVRNFHVSKKKINP